MLLTITSIPKIRNTNKCDEYRPINAMANDEEILESIVKKQFVEYIEKNNILDKNQSAFRAKHSCETALNCAINEQKFLLDKGRVILIVFLDFKRAFGTVDKKRMIEKLKIYGVNGKELDLFKNFLNGRKQRVKYKNSTSGENEVPICLPQGTALSVILFTLYINDMMKTTKIAL